MAQTVIFFCFCHLPVLIGVAAEPARVKFAHGNISRTMDNPPRQLTAQPRTPANADLGAAATPVVSDPRCRPDQWITIGRMRDGTMHFPLDPQFGEDRHSVHGVFEPGHNAVIVSFEQFIFCFPWAVIFPDRVWVFLLINPDQPRFLFHADIT